MIQLTDDSIRSNRISSVKKFGLPFAIVYGGVCLKSYRGVTISNFSCQHGEGKESVEGSGQPFRCSKKTVVFPVFPEGSNQTVTTDGRLVVTSDFPPEPLGNIDVTTNVAFDYLDLSIPKTTPLVTISPHDFQETSFGKATIDTFRGQWVAIKQGEPYSSYNYSYCPVLNSHQETHNIPLCGTHNRPRVAKNYVASGLRPFNASRFINWFEARGPLALVGDSLMAQSARSLRCMTEAELGPGVSVPMVLHQRSFVAVPRAEILETIEIRAGLESNFHSLHFDPDLSWVDTAIQQNTSVVVFNTGAWWAKNLYKRGDWCKWKQWTRLSGDTVVALFEDSMRSNLLPGLLKLKSKGITVIWRDTPPGGQWDEESGDVRPCPYCEDYKLFPVFNRIGRKIAQEAGGLVLPIYDLRCGTQQFGLTLICSCYLIVLINFPSWSFFCFFLRYHTFPFLLSFRFNFSMSRSDDHIFDDATYTPNDFLHWCSGYSPYTVPSVWVQLLQAVLMGDENGDAIGLTSEPSISESSSKSISRSGRDDSRDKFSFLNHDDNHSYSKSGASLCECSSATSFLQCRANTKCQWTAGKCTKDVE
jgi:hypothetical protein